LSVDFLENVALAISPLAAEQQKIADCLISLDELIAAQARKVEALKTHKKGLMQQLFPREGETQPRLRFPEFQDAGEWVVSELGGQSDVRDGTHDSPSFFSTGLPLVTSKNLRPDGTLDLENVSLISEEDYVQINKRSKVSVGDILFGMIGTIGNPVLIKSEGFAIKNVALIKEVGPLSNSFLVQLLQSGYVAAIFAVLNTGNSQKFIALGKIRGLPISTPLLPEQKRIADCLTSFDNLITAATQEFDTLKTHKKGLMQQLFPSFVGN
jgi:type I restriction enzyme S subunit